MKCKCSKFYSIFINIPNTTGWQHVINKIVIFNNKIPKYNGFVSLKLKYNRYKFYIKIIVSI